MVEKSHPLTRMVVALCVAVATLSACGATPDREPTGGADSAQQDGQRQQPKGRKEQKRPQKAAARPTATNADLDAYVASGEKALRQMLGGTFKKIYSEIDIVPVYPNGIEYDYTFRTAVDPAVAKPQLDTQAPTLRTQARTVIMPEMEKFGFARPTVTYTFRNPDGTVVWTREFS